MAQDGEAGKEALKWYIAIARGGGFSFNLNSAITILLTCRLSVTKLRGTTLHRVMPLDESYPRAHIFVTYAILIGVIIYVPWHFEWLITFKCFDKLRLWSFTTTVTRSMILLVVLLSMFFITIPLMRRKFFCHFYVVHNIGAALFLILLVLHGNKRHVRETHQRIIPSMIVYAVDRVARRVKTFTYELELS